MKICRNIYIDKNCNIVIDDLFDEKYINIYIIQHSSGQTITILKKKESDQVICNFHLDGNYNICRIDVPLNKANPYYYKDGKFYKNLIEVEIREIVQVNPEISKLNFNYDNYFCKCHLWNCYINICQEIFNQRASFKCDSPDIDKFLIYKRDLLNSTLNVIDYLVSLEQYSEAERLLERVKGCNGLCNDMINNKSCGCL